MVGLESWNIVLSKVSYIVLLNLRVVLRQITLYLTLMEYELKYFQIFILYYLQELLMGHLKYQLEEEHEQVGVRELYLGLA